MGQVPVSELIALGRTLLKPRRRMRWSLDGTEGCAMGMAEAAAGFKAVDGDGSVRQLETLYPWLDVELFYPCECEPGKKIDVSSIIEHLFDNHIAVGRLVRFPAWTMEQLIDWVHKVEPKPAKKHVDKAAVENLHLSQVK